MRIDRFHLLALLLLTLLSVAGCSNSNSEAPLPGQAHPQNWLLQHPTEAKADLAGCTICHGTDFRGGSVGVACFDCHLSGPPFTIHPNDWTAPVTDHQNFAQKYSWTGCANAACHGPQLQGGTVGPSCLNSSASCHANTGGDPPPPHATGFQDPALHGPQAKPNQFYCRNCHGRPPNTFDGGFIADPQILNNPAGNCSNCHTAAKAHPTGWQGSDNANTSYSASHQGVSDATIQTSCALCHKTDGAGAGPMPGAPSCFSASFVNADGSTTSCHPGGPGEGAPHALPFTDPNLHGPVAKQDLSFCQTCHGTPGTIAFDGGSVGVACSACHTAAGAHPTNWQGTDDTAASNNYLSSHRTAGSTGTACTICHDVTQGRTAPNANAPSCFSASFTNADGNTSSCHPGGPGAAPHALPFTDPNLHGPVAKGDLSYCQTCHGTPGTIQFDGGSVGVACSACHTAAGAHPTDWQGTDDTLASNNHLSSHRSAGNLNTACSICHDFTQGRTAPNSAAPSCFSASFTNANGNTTTCHPTGPGAPHAVGAAWLDPSGHGAEAKQDLTYCQGCHAQPASGGTNPRFNVAIGNLTNGCEDCHNDGTAHPSVGTRDSRHWYGTYTHSTAQNFATACALCHGADLGGGAGPACSSCHTAGSPLTLTACTSCHNTPPDSLGPGGNARPNRDGTHVEHNQLANVTSVCSTCHSGAGPGTDNHYDTTAPADVNISATYQAKTGAFAYNATGHSCSGVSCHGGQATPDWYGGTIDVASQCKSCHQLGTNQYNSYNSGQHSRHVNAFGDTSSTCVLCHDASDPNKLSAYHFTDLNTQAMNNAGLTIKASIGFNPATGTCATPGCHGSETW